MITLWGIVYSRFPLFVAAAGSGAAARRGGIMLSIRNNLPALNITRNLAANSRTQQSAMEKLSSGFRINKASDDPSGLIFSEKLRAQIEGLERAVRNTDESGNLMSIMDGGLSQVQNVLRDMQKLAIASANQGVVSADQLSANQAEMDNALLAINRILDTTNVGGRKVLSNVLGTAVSNPGNASIPIAGGGSGQPLSDENVLGMDCDFTITGTGENGDQEITLSFKKGQTLDEVLEKLRAVDTARTVTDPDAEYTIEDEDLSSFILLSKTGKMDAASVENLKNVDDDRAKEILSGVFTRASFPSSGTALLDRNQLSDADKELLESASSLSDLGLQSIGSISVGTGRFDKFGNEVQQTYTLNDLFSGKDASLSRDPTLALRVIGESQSQIAGLRASIGSSQAMQEYLNSARETELENLTRMESGVRDTDMAVTVAEYSRANILMEMGTRLLKSTVEQSRMVLDLLA